MTDTFFWEGTIQTYTGEAFCIADPDPGTIVLEDIAHPLALQCRYNGHVPTFYSVAEHSVRVASMLAGYGADMMLAGLLHDAAEAYVGDMVRPMKRMQPLVKAYQDVEDKVADAIAMQLGGIFPLPDAVHAADRECYEWEVENIRTGAQPGWPAHYAESAFIGTYYELTQELGM